ncbi:hypothetical protein GWQ44_23695 [Pseudomonas sp. 3MA1]|uniref:hypothetical protein n=1 Tax=Pseudomonas sp. 3MA1 TaxID=2699196 RepID=UPI0023DDC9C4|nr:hypothetical protein [Pseudomonas sp. 3MA1]MDF2398561.1 hypothetical protein [Pseudomonas sp. 3MA1]
MLTAKATFVMSSIGLFVRTARSNLLAEDPRVQIASPPKAILAICNESPSHHQDKPLFLKDFLKIDSWHASCLSKRTRTTEITPIHSAPLLLNVIAIIVLATFHFQPADNARPAALDYQNGLKPHLAIMNTQPAF